MKKTGLNGYTYDFNVDCNAIAVADILGIHKYLMKKMEQYKMFRFVKQIFVSTMMFFGCDVSGVNSLNAVSKCISMNDQECKRVNKV